MASLGDDRIDERMSRFLSAAGQEAAGPDEVFLERLREQSTEAFLAASKGASMRSVRYTIMNKRSIRWLLPIAAAAAAVLVMVGVWPGGAENGRVYAMTDVPGLLRGARTLHMVGRLFLPPYAMPGQEQTEVPYEVWADPENCRLRRPNPSYSVTPGGVTITRGEIVSDGQYRMTVNHTENTVSYERLNDFHRRLQGRLNMEQLYKDVVGRIEGVGGFVKTGQEDIDGRTYDVWEGVMEEPELNMAMKIKGWLAPRSGEIGRLQMFMKGPFGGVWAPAFHLDSIARNVLPAADAFDTSPPAGYTLLNSKETAAVPELRNESGGGVGSVSYTGHIAFQIGERAVLLGWSSADKEDETSQADLFSGLEVGGPLPKLPFEVYALKRTIGKEEVVYTGRHLAYTRTGARYHEWSLYVADRELPAKTASCYYRILQRYNVPAEKVIGELVLDTSGPIAVGPDDFDILVRGAMAELSDEKTAPAYVTYENVMKLIEEARAGRTDGHDGGALAVEQPADPARAVGKRG